MNLDELKRTFGTSWVVNTEPNQPICGGFDDFPSIRRNIPTTMCIKEILGEDGYSLDSAIFHARDDTKKSIEAFVEQVEKRITELSRGVFSRSKNAKIIDRYNSVINVVRDQPITPTEHPLPADLEFKMSVIPTNTPVWITNITNHIGIKQFRVVGAKATMDSLNEVRVTYNIRSDDGKSLYFTQNCDLLGSLGREVHVTFESATQYMREWALCQIKQLEMWT